MKSRHSHSSRVELLSATILALAVIGLFPWGLAAQTPAPDLKRSSAATPARARGPAANKAAPDTATTRPAIATFSAGKLKIAVDAVRWAKGERTVSLKDSGFPIAANLLAGGQGSGAAHGSSGWSSGSGASDGSGGSGAASGGSGSAAGGGSGAAGASGKRWGYVSGGGTGGASGGWSSGSGGSAGPGGRGGAGGSGGYSAGGSGGSGAGGWSSGGSAGGGGGTGSSSAGGSGGSGTSSWSSGGGAGSGSGGPGAGGSSGWSAGGGAGGGDVGTANLVIDLQVSGPKNNSNQLLCTVLGKVQAKDDLGNAIDAPDVPAHLRMQVSGLEYPQGSGCAAVHLNLKNEQAKSIKSLSGDLLVMDARVQTTAFQGKELDRVSTRQLNGVTVRLSKVESAEDGIKVSAGVSMPNPFADKLNFHNMQNRLRVVLEDSEGKTHTARSASGGGGGGGGGSSGGSFSSGGGGSGGVRSGARAGGGAETRSLASYNLQFAPLPQGVTVKKIVCTVTELLSEPQRVTFRFSDLPLP
jgi:hypothetical protein